MPTEYQIRAHQDCFQPDIEKYWVALFEADLLKYRFCDTPQPATVEHALDEHGETTYFVFAKKLIVAEFTLDNFAGRSARVHFSMHPSLSSQHTAYLAKTVGDSILNDWKVGDERFLDAMYGMTPTENRVACLFVQRAGFKKLGILPSGCDYLGGISDAMLTLKTREAS